MILTRNNLFCSVQLVACLIFHEFNPTMAQELMADCQPLNPRKGITMICKTPENKIADCSRTLSPGSTVDYRCGEFYRPLLRSVVPRKLQCESTGTWSNWRRFQEYLCEIDCGNPVRPHIPNISLGQETLRYSWPWHAAIFVQSADDSSRHDYICGGSLISLRVLLTAAHCVVTYQKFDLDLYYIVFGAISSNWEENVAQEFVQILKVKRKIVPEEYDRREYRSDIGLLELERPITLTKSVSPVCFPYDNDFGKPEDPHVIGEGEVVGYGKDEHGIYQLHLKYTKLPVVAAGECYKILDKAPGREQFCAGVVNGSAVCPGDSGGGMVFKGLGGSRYYIQGIVSNNLLMRERSVPCHGLSYFTNVLHFTRWVADHVDRIDQESHDKQIQGDIDDTSTIPAMKTVTTAMPTARQEPPQKYPEAEYVPESSEIEDKYSISPKAEGEGNICRFGCSHITERGRKYMLKDADFDPNIFKQASVGKGCSFACFELDTVKVNFSDLITALKECTRMTSICMTNVDMIGLQDQPLFMPQLREFKLIISENKKLNPSEVQALIFFDGRTHRNFNDMITHLDTNIQVGSVKQTSLIINRKKQQILLKFEQCDGILENRVFEVEDLTLVDCEVRSDLIPNTLTSFVLGRSSTAGKSIKDASTESVNDLVRKQVNLTRLTVRTNEVYNVYVEEIPREIKKLFLSKNARLTFRSQDSFSLEPFLHLEEMYVKDFWEGKLLQHFYLVFPNLKQLGIRGKNMALLEEAMANPSVLRIGGMDWECCFNFTSSEDSSDKLNKILKGLSVPNHKSYFILERDLKGGPWRVDPTVRSFSNITAMFWNT